jgi:hypothetical protein
MKKYYFILLVLLGMFLISSNAVACGKDSEKSSCKKESTSKTQKDDCCDSDNHSKSKNHNGCGGKCGHAKCGCTIVTNGFTATIELNFKNNNFDFSTEKQKFSNTETFISSGFHSLWLIPKIS